MLLAVAPQPSFEGRAEAMALQRRQAGLSSGQSSALWPFGFNPQRPAAGKADTPSTSSDFVSSTYVSLLPVCLQVPALESCSCTITPPTTSPCCLLFVCLQPPALELRPSTIIPLSLIFAFSSTITSLFPQSLARPSTVLTCSTLGERGADVEPRSSLFSLGVQRSESRTFVMPVSPENSSLLKRVPHVGESWVANSLLAV